MVLAVAAEQITARVQALRAPAPRPAAWRIAALLAVLLLATASTLLAAHDTERLFELANTPTSAPTTSRDQVRQLRASHARTRGPSDRFGVGIVDEGAQSIIGPLVGHLGSAALLALITGWTRQPH